MHVDRAHGRLWRSLNHRNLHWEGNCRRSQQPAMTQFEFCLGSEAEVASNRMSGRSVFRFFAKGSYLWPDFKAY